MQPDPYDARRVATQASPEYAPIHALLYVGDQLGELVTVAGADRHDRAADRVAARVHLAMVCCGAVGVAAVVGGIIVDGGWAFVALALAALIVIGAVSEAGR